MRAFVGELNRPVLVALLAGLLVGAVWLAWTGPGFVVAWLGLIAGAVGLLIRRRWLEIGAFMLGAGVVPAIGYRILGAPELPALIDDQVVPVEAFAPVAADLLGLGGIIALAVASLIGMREGSRRERHEAEHQARKRRRLWDQPS